MAEEYVVWSIVNGDAFGSVEIVHEKSSRMRRSYTSLFLRAPRN